MKKCELCCNRDARPCYECNMCLGGDDHFKADKDKCAALQKRQPATEPKRIEVTQEMLELALLCCAKDDPAPAGTEPCEGCYLQQMHLVKDGHMSTGMTCFKHLAIDAIAYIRKINNFEKSQCADLLRKLEVERIENAQLHAVIVQSDLNFFKRKCRFCGCDWNHPCNDDDYWVEDDLCSACAKKMHLGDE